MKYVTQRSLLLLGSIACLSCVKRREKKRNWREINEMTGENISVREEMFSEEKEWNWLTWNLCLVMWREKWRRREEEEKKKGRNIEKEGENRRESWRSEEGKQKYWRQPLIEETGEKLLWKKKISANNYQRRAKRGNERLMQREREKSKRKKLWSYRATSIFWPYSCVRREMKAAA